MKKLFISLVAICFAFTVNAQEVKTSTPDANKPEFKFEKMEYNYGSIKQGDKVDYEFVFTNVGKEPLIISSASGSCGCTVPEWPKEPIRKGEKGKIKVTFNSAGKQGMQDKTVTINSNAATNPVVLHIKGNVEVPPAPAEGAKTN
jgi:hypothetical protein